MKSDPQYDERLGVPLRWWVQGTMLVASLWLAVVVALPAVAAWTIRCGGDGAARPGAPRLGRRGSACATASCAPAAPTSRSRTSARSPPSTPRRRRTAGREADARAYLLLRPYLKRAVRVQIAERTPCWLVSTRHPDELAQVLVAISDSPAG